MTVTNQGVSLLDSLVNAQDADERIGVAVLKKAQDAVKQQGADALALLEQAVPPPAAQPDPGSLDTYA